jgi:predicted nuclease with TOPRIM domain
MNDSFNLQEFIEQIDNTLIEEEKNEVIKGIIISRLSHIKKYLDNSDYKIIKCYEAQLLQEEMPYNLQELLAQRKAWRDEINALEFEISMLG